MIKDERLAAALADAERSGMCLWARDAQSRRKLRRLAARGELVAVRNDLFSRPSYWDGLSYGEMIMHILRAVGAQYPFRVFGQISGAAIWKLNDTYLMHDRVHFATDLRGHSRNLGYFSFHAVPDLIVEIRDGLRVTGLLQTVFDCIRTLPFPQALAICDAAMRIYGVSRAQLETFVGEHRGFKGVTAARRVVVYADGLSENGGESVVRALLIGWGYAVPLLQQWVTDPVDGRRYRVDFLWILPNGEMIVLELDGREKYVNPAMFGEGDTVDVLLAEKERENNIRLLGNVRFVRGTYKEFEREPERMRRKLDLAGVPKASGDP